MKKFVSIVMLIFLVSCIFIGCLEEKDVIVGVETLVNAEDLIVYESPIFVEM